MKITAEISAREWAQEREMLSLHLKEWLDCCPVLAKGGGQVAVEAGKHPLKAVDGAVASLKSGYTSMLADMNDAIIKYLRGELGKDPY